MAHHHTVLCDTEMCERKESDELVAVRPVCHAARGISYVVAGVGEAGIGSTSSSTGSSVLF